MRNICIWFLRFTWVFKLNNKIYFYSFFFLIIYVHETLFKKEVLKKSDSHRRGLELDGFVYAEWCMNKNIQKADFTQYENLLLQVGCHYCPGAKTTLEMLKLQQLPVLCTDLWKSFAKCVSFYITRNLSPFVSQNQTTTASKKLVEHRQRNTYNIWRGSRLFCGTFVSLWCEEVIRGKNKILSKEKVCKQAKQS